MELFEAVGWLLRTWYLVFGTFGVVALVVGVVIVLAIIIGSFRIVGSFVGRMLGIRDFRFREWRVTHPVAWQWCQTVLAVLALVVGVPRAIGNPTGVTTMFTVLAAWWLINRVLRFWSDYPLSWEGLVAATQTAVTRQALDLVWLDSVTTEQRGKLRTPRYTSWTVARMQDGFRFGLHCNEFIPPQGTGGLGRIMEMCQSPGSEWDEITSNLNNYLLDEAELRGPLIWLLRRLDRVPLYKGTLIDRPDHYPAGVGRLTLLEQIPLHRVRDYPWRPGYWVDQLRTRESAGATLPQAVAQLVDRGAPVGFDSDGRIVFSPCDDEHTSLMGRTRTGKSTLLESVLHFLVEMPPALVQLHIVDLKGGAHLAGYRDRCASYSETPEQAEQVLRHLVTQVMRPRFAMFRQRGIQKIDEPSVDYPFVFIVIDEGSDLTPVGLELCADIAQLGAAGRVMLRFSTQYMRQEDGMPRRLSLNMNNRESTRLPDVTASLVAMQRGGLAANCAPHLIGRRKADRGIFCHSFMGADPSYAKSWRTGGIVDQRRRTRLALRVWGAPVPLVLVAAPPPPADPPAAPEPAAEPEVLDLADGWDRDAMAHRLAALARACGQDLRLDPDRVTHHRVRTAVNAARRRWSRQRPPAELEALPPAERTMRVARARSRIDQLGRELHADIDARDDQMTAQRGEPAVVT
jgi:hypothetical protein